MTLLRVEKITKIVLIAILIILITFAYYKISHREKVKDTQEKITEEVEEIELRPINVYVIDYGYIDKENSLFKDEQLVIEENIENLTDEETEEDYKEITYITLLIEDLDNIGYYYKDLTLETFKNSKIIQNSGCRDWKLAKGLKLCTIEILGHYNVDEMYYHLETRSKKYEDVIGWLCGKTNPYSFYDETTDIEEYKNNHNIEVKKLGMAFAIDKLSSITDRKPEFDIFEFNGDYYIKQFEIYNKTIITENTQYSWSYNIIPISGEINKGIDNYNTELITNLDDENLKYKLITKVIDSTECKPYTFELVLAYTLPDETILYRSDKEQKIDIINNIDNIITEAYREAELKIYDTTNGKNIIIDIQ